MTRSEGRRRNVRKGAAGLAAASMLLLLVALAWPCWAREFVLGMSAPFSGASRTLGLEYLRGGMAWFERFNASGGIDGATVRVVAYDDGYDPGPCLKNTLRLIREDKVFALFSYVGTPTTTKILPLLIKFGEHDMRLLFPLTGAEPLRQPPYDRFVYNLRASYLQEAKALVDHFVNQGLRRVAVFYQADAYGRSGWDAVRSRLRWHGLEMVSEVAYRRGASFHTDFSAEAALLGKSSPRAVIVVGTAPACAAIVRDLRDGGIDVPVAALSFADADSILGLLKGVGEGSGGSYSEGLVFSQVVPSYEDLSLPGVRLFREVMDGYDGTLPGGVELGDYRPHRYSSVAFEGFLNARLLTEMLRHLPEGREAGGIDAAFEAMTEVDMGIGEPIRFGPNRRQGLNRVYLTVVRDGRLIQLDGDGEAARQ